MADENVFDCLTAEEHIYWERAVEVPSARAVVMLMFVGALHRERMGLVRLQERMARMDAALASGPARLREMSADIDRKLPLLSSMHDREMAVIRSADLVNAALHVEAAQLKTLVDDGGCDG